MRDDVANPRMQKRLAAVETHRTGSAVGEVVDETTRSLGVHLRAMP
jgi:hypothetical protein